MSDLADKHFVVINKESIIDAEQLIKLINNAKLNPRQAEQLQRAVEAATVK
jgi:hypothetical protein